MFQAQARMYGQSKKLFSDSDFFYCEETHVWNKF